MKLGSLFDGSGGFPLAGTINGIEPAWASEIEMFPIKVTKARFPQMQHLGDVTKIKGAEIEPVDIVTFGSPCQDLSVAGKQKGIHEGERSNLFFEAVRIIKEMRESDRAAGREGKYIRPRWAVWENVPGAFSSNGGDDFRAVLQALAEVADLDVVVPRPEKWNRPGCIVGSGWSIAWRILDAQYWGVPQRRRRIYLVADFAGERAGEILFEREGVSGDTEPCGETGQKATGDAGGSAEGGGGVRRLNPWDSQTIRQYDANGIYPTLTSREKSGLNRAGVVYTTMAAFMGGQGAKARSIAWCDDGTTPTIRSAPSGSNTVPDVVYAMQAFGLYKESEVASALKQRDYKDATDLVYSVDCRNLTEHPELYPTLQAKSTGGHSLNYSGALRVQNIVRRLTPTECARLQGFPDWWDADVEGSDSARYKMWGNGIALPCAEFVLRRIAEFAKIERMGW